MGAFVKSVCVALFATISAFAASECEGKRFASLSVNDAQIGSLLAKTSSQCGLSVLIKDEAAQNVVSKKVFSLQMRDFTLEDLLSILLVENNLGYEIKNSILKIYGFETKTFKVDYITAVRSAQTKINTGTAGGQTNSGGVMDKDSISSKSEFKTNEPEIVFWESLRDDIEALLRPDKSVTEYESQREITVNKRGDEVKKNDKQNEIVKTKNNNIIINPQAGLITVTAKPGELTKIEKYINAVLERVHRQALLDVQILEVTMSSGQTVGIDWNQIYNLQNINISYGSDLTKSVSSAYNAVTTQVGSEFANSTANSFIRNGAIALSGGIQINDIIKFLKTQGDVKSISNPKILALNNQPALISSGDVIFYPKVSGGTSATATSGATNPSVIPESMQVGVMLDITPEIIDEKNLLLKINPRSSDCKVKNCPLQPVLIAGVVYNMPPNIAEKQISSVIKASDGDRIILGGLIQEVSNENSSKVPLAGDIPLLGYLFKQDADVKETKEMVIIITPRIVKNQKTPDAKELGYSKELGAPK